MLIGDKINRLTLIEYLPTKKGHKMGKFICDCGNEKVCRLSGVITENTKSCSCLNTELIIKLGKAGFIHGASIHGKQTAEYRTYIKLKQRCYNKNNPKYPIYGARGIIVCDRWLESFLNFLEDMGKRPPDKTSIDRIDVNGNYEPSNCRWADEQTQASNKQNTVNLEYNGEKIHQAKFARMIGVDPHSVEYHLKKGKDAYQIIEHFKKFKSRKYANSLRSVN
jgi:hypothetical protein